MVQFLSVNKRDSKSSYLKLAPKLSGLLISSGRPLDCLNSSENWMMALIAAKLFKNS